MSSQSSGSATVSSEPRGSLGAIAALVRTLSTRRRVQLIGITALMIISGAAEVVTLGAVLPLLGFLSRGSDTSGGWIVEVIRYVPALKGMNVTSVLTVVFACAA